MVSMAFPVILVVQGSDDASRRLPRGAYAGLAAVSRFSGRGPALHAAHRAFGGFGGLCSSVDLVQTVFHRL
jgi:hypothetical protein